MAQEKRRTPAILNRQVSEYPFARARFYPLILFQEPPPPANPVISFRYGRGILEGPQAFVPPSYIFFPYFDQTQQPANLVIPFLQSRLLGGGDPPLPAAKFLPFPYFQPPAPAAANPIIGFLYGRDGSVPPVSLVRSHFFSFIAPPVIAAAAIRTRLLLRVGV